MKATKETLVVGAKVWVAGPSKWANKPVPMEVVIIGKQDKGHTMMFTGRAIKPEFQGKCFSYTSGFFPSDYGVPEYTYDNRCCQIFTTEQEMADAIKLWNGRNPNCVDEEGNDINHIIFMSDIEGY